MSGLAMSLVIRSVPTKPFTEATVGRHGVLLSFSLHPVGTVSHRPFPGLAGEVGTARGTRALPGGGSGLGPVVEIRARRPAGSGWDGVSPSVSWVGGRGGDRPWDTGPTGGWQRPGAGGGDAGQEARWFR